jgi:mannose/fructose/N-acetylgalactosamine-specific phosphotransferase system component IIC
MTPLFIGSPRIQIQHVVSAIPQWRAVDSTVDAICILALGYTMLLPASLIAKKNIVVGGR